MKKVKRKSVQSEKQTRRQLLREQEKQEAEYLLLLREAEARQQEAERKEKLRRKIQFDSDRFLYG